MSKPTAKYLKDYQQPNFLIPETELFFNLEDEQTLVRSKLSIKKNGKHNKDLILDCEVDKVVQVKIDGQQITNYVIDDKKLTIKVPSEDFCLEIESVVNPVANTALEGLYKSSGVYCTQCEAEGFRKITPFLDRPDILSVYTVHVFADSAANPHILSNGNLLERATNEEGDNSVNYVKWFDPHPKPSYLFALVAGDFDILTDYFVTASGRNVALELYVDKGNLHLADHAMSSLKKSMAWDEQVYGLEYDLDIYMIVAVDFFNMGAMENKGLNVFNSKYVLADQNTATDQDFHGIESVIAHEYFHNWTGNRVTCRDWFQLSLKEGLTVFRDQQFSADMGEEALERISHANVIRTAQFEEDAGPMAHPIRPEKVIEMNNFYTVTVYDKGAEVIRMMHSLLGKEGFRSGMDLYFERHDGNAVTCEDFVSAMADANNADLSQFKNWYSQAGTPEVTVIESNADGKYTIEFTQQIPSRPESEQVLTMVIPVKYELLDLVTGESVDSGTLVFDQVHQTFEFNVERPVIAVLFEGFSAPVKVRRGISVEKMCLIATNAKDEFSRWDALQSLWHSALESETVQDKLAETLVSVLEDTKLDLGIKAELLAIPNFAALTENQLVINVERTLDGQQNVVNKFLKLAQPLLVSKLKELVNIEVAYEKHAVASRKLNTVLLSYLGHSHNAQAEQAIQQHFDNAANMTEKMAALNAMRCCNLKAHNALLSALDQEYDGNVLVLDKLLASVAKVEDDGVYEQIKQWSEHSAFDHKNPNRLRSLFGTFVMANAKVYHHISGKGYAFLTDLLLQIDKFNPQVASRLITPLLSFKRYDIERQDLMRQCLVKLSENELSKDLFEKVTNALND